MPRKPKIKDATLDTLIKESVEAEDTQVEIVPIEDVEIMSMSQMQHEKQLLAAKRDQVMLKLDGRRLDQSTKIMDAMDVALNNMISSVTYDEEGNTVPLSAMDFNFYSTAYKNLSSAFNIVSRLDSVDNTGKAGRVSLKIEFDV